LHLLEVNTAVDYL